MIDVAELRYNLGDCRDAVSAAHASDGEGGGRAQLMLPRSVDSELGRRNRWFSSRNSYGPLRHEPFTGQAHGAVSRTSAVTTLSPEVSKVSVSFTVPPTTSGSTRSISMMW